MEPLSVHDQISQLDKARAYYDKVARVVSLYAWFGVVISIVSLIYLAFSFLDVRLTTQQQISVVATGVGAGMTLVSVGYASYWRTKKQADYSRIIRMRAV